MASQSPESTIDGNVGDDRLVGGTDNDRLRSAVDAGDVDPVECGDGTSDVAIVDQLKVVRTGARGDPVRSVRRRAAHRRLLSPPGEIRVLKAARCA